MAEYQRVAKYGDGGQVLYPAEFQEYSGARIMVKLIVGNEAIGDAFSAAVLSYGEDADAFQTVTLEQNTMPPLYGGETVFLMRSQSNGYNGWLCISPTFTAFGCTEAE